MVRRVDKLEVLRQLERGAQVVDVLPESEFLEKRLPGAVNLPLNKLNRQSINQLNTKLPVIVYCWDGLCDQSSRAAALLEAFGFDEVYDYLAGKADWLASDLPADADVSNRVETGDLTRWAETCNLDERSEDVVTRLRDCNQSTGVVVHSSEVVVGTVELDQLEHDPERRIEEVMDFGPTTFRPDVDPSMPFAYMRENKLDRAVVTRPDGTLIGIIERRSIEGISDRKHS